jgi:hypothetical protein
VAAPNVGGFDLAARKTGILICWNSGKKGPSTPRRGIASYSCGVVDEQLAWAAGVSQGL